MNNQPLLNKSGESSRCPVNRLVLTFCLFAAMMSMPAGALAQTAKWLYVTTDNDGGKSYLRDEIKILPNRNKSGWQKLVKPDGSSLVILTEWDCLSRRSLVRQLTPYTWDGETSGTAKPSPRWDQIIPDSIADLYYVRVCPPHPIVKWARMGSSRTALRRQAGMGSPIIRVAEPGERFEIVFETAKLDWVNVVDVETQQDYWLFHKWFETVEADPPLKKRSVTADASSTKTTPFVKKQKPQPKANARKTKN